MMSIWFIGSINIGYRVHWTLCPLDTISIGSIVSIGHDVQWIQWIQWKCPMLFNGSNGSIVKNTKLMFTRQTKFGDCVHWIHSDGSIGHPLDPLDMSIEHRKWIQWIHWIHWTPLYKFTDGYHVQWTSIGHYGFIGLDSQLLWPFFRISRLRFTQLDRLSLRHSLVDLSHISDRGQSD